MSGFTGMPNFGQAGFMAIGAYAIGAAGRRLGLVALARAARRHRACRAGRPVRRHVVAAPAGGPLRHRDDRLCRDRPLHAAKRRLLRRQPGCPRLRRRNGAPSPTGCSARLALGGLGQIHAAAAVHRGLARPSSRFVFGHGAAAHALGPRPARHPRGRGRDRRARQERLLLQAAVARHRRRRWLPSPASSSRST